MKKEIKVRLEKGWNPTKKQCQWIMENINPQFEIGCVYCMFNLRNYLDISNV